MDDESNNSTVEIEARYVPVPVKLEPRESINSTLFRLLADTFFMKYTDQGVLRVELIEGRDLMAVDRGGMTLHTCYPSLMTLCTR